MRLLLDTHALLWWDGDAARLPETVREALADPANEVALSVVNAWEMQIKASLGKLTLRRPVDEIYLGQVNDNGFRSLAVELPHVLALGSPPDRHRDPFDLLIAQAVHEGFTVVSKDAVFGGYPVAVLWG